MENTTIDDGTAVEIALEYANTPDYITQKKISEEEGMTLYAVKKSIEIAVTEALISFDDCEKIRQKKSRNQIEHGDAVRSLETGADKRFRTKLYPDRNTWIQEIEKQKNELIQKIEFVQEQIRTYYKVYSDADEAPSKEALEKELEKYERDLEWLNAHYFTE